MCFSPLYISAKLRNLMKIRDSAFKSKNREAYTTARADLSRAIKEAKRQYADKINNKGFTSTKDTRRLWQGIQTITGYKPTHMKTQLPQNLDPLQFAYRPNHFTDDANSSALHLSLSHLNKNDTYIRMLFIDFSSAINTVIPQKLVKLDLLGINTSLCNWILDFLTDRPQSVFIGNKTSEVVRLSTGSPQGCVLNPLLFTLLTHDCTAQYSSNHIIKFADDTTVVGLITNNDESEYREEVQHLVDWCQNDNLSLNVQKTKDMVVNFRKSSTTHTPLHINGSAVEMVNSVKFLDVHISADLSWNLNTTTMKKAQQHLHFLRKLKKASLPPPIILQGEPLRASSAATSLSGTGTVPS